MFDLVFSLSSLGYSVRTSVACIVKANTIVIYDVGVVNYATNSGVTVYDAGVVFFQLKILDYDASVVFTTL